MDESNALEKSLPSSLEALFEAWSHYSIEEKREKFFLLPRLEAEELFLFLPSAEQVELLAGRTGPDLRSWVRVLPADDAADFIQASEPDAAEGILSQFDPQMRREVTALLAYAEDDAGGRMNSSFVRLRPEMLVDEAILYLRAQARTRVETIYYAYVLDPDQRLLGVVSLRELVSAASNKRVSDIMNTEFVSVTEDLDQEELSRIISQYDVTALPVVDVEGRMKGIVTVDDVVDVVQEEATEDIQKFGGMEALNEPYLRIGFLQMIRKRAGWLLILFVGEMFTASAMAYYEHEIQRAVVLALFIPLIISSGGNSGSQASTLIIRAMALDEVRIRDWWRVLGRELGVGLCLGAFLGLVGLVRILVFPMGINFTGSVHGLIALTVALSVLGTVVWGTLAGAMLPFLLRRCKLDPASASAPFVATLVDVSGLVIYFTLASLILRGTLL